MTLETSNKLEKQVLDQCSSFSKVRSSNGFRMVALTLLILFVLLLGCLILIPWQQSISGYGRVSVYSPMDRPQPIETPITARIKKWYVQEGQLVKEGQVLLELTEIDPKYLDPYQLERMEAQKTALLSRLNATEDRIASLKSQATFLSQSRNVAVPSAQLKVSQSQNKIEAAKQALTAAKQNLKTAELNLNRLRELNQKGLRSNRDLELAEQGFVDAETKVQQAQAYLNVALQDQNIASFDQTKVSADMAASLSNIQASIASTYETLGSTNSDLAKLDVEIENMKNRIRQRKIRAPKAGIVVRIMNVGLGETVNEGDVLATLMPQGADQAVELLVSDNDAPLVSVGRPVRLQFAGWPALQFAGWPAVAVGTFAGRVTVIDAIDDGTNRYRVWVKVDEKAIREGQEQPWPSIKHLRPGSEAIGWIMLDTVPLWFELWRQFNAFPPTISMETLEVKPQKTFGPKDDIKKPKKK